MAGAVVIGAGPGIGRSVALRFAREGLPITLIARTTETLTPLAAEIGTALALTADVTDEKALKTALDTAMREHGVPEVVVYNAAIIQADAPGKLSVERHLAAWSVNVVGAITAAAHVAPRMAERGSGTIIVTGGMPEAVPAYTSLSLGKAGVRALVSLLDTQFGPSGVHVATVTVAGPVAKGTPFDPDDIAEHYWRLHTQPRADWTQEIVHKG
ncbi:short-chain dehydrogenase [Amycolatopsis sp. WAC 04182]|uniref:SDR family NAD(P)-dependent oxidoreductase n=1 Tax=Amycolatopsis sp. WAC 04182 TaxID=2203198 RepID=UPI000F77D1A7|nr:SDR family NAD(P)-dependent oxidoreductase [Amycolatopsis sp. WAC 04182]RSN60860.1 short-chain dehydrogenase [Amycolatopsis sp. WAC 04182]